jgi:hypothetical protein
MKKIKAIITFKFGTPRFTEISIIKIDIIQEDIECNSDDLTEII